MYFSTGIKGTIEQVQAQAIQIAIELIMVNTNDTIQHTSMINSLIQADSQW